MFGVDGRPVSVEVHVSTGIPGFCVVGQPDAACREAIRLLRERMVPRTVELGPASIASILAAVLGSSDVDLDIGAASVTPQTTH